MGSTRFDRAQRDGFLQRPRLLRGVPHGRLSLAPDKPADADGLAAADPLIEPEGRRGVFGGGDLAGVAVDENAAGDDRQGRAGKAQRVGQADLAMRRLGRNAGDAPGIVQRGRDREGLGAERLDGDVVPGDQRHLVGVVDDERGVAVAEFLDQEAGRHPLRLLDEPADLDLAVKRVLDGSPGHELGAEEEPVVGEELVRLVGRADRPFERRTLLRRGPTQDLLIIPEFVGEREDAEPFIGPADEPAVDVVQVLVDHQVLVKRDHPFAHPADLGGDALVALGVFALPRGVPGTTEDHSGRVVKRLHARDVGMIAEELGDRPGLGPAERELPCAPLNVVRLPVARPVPVHVVTAGRVFVDQAVAVVVDPFVAEQVVLAVVFTGLDGDEQPRVFGRDLEAAMRRLAPHLGDLAVAVEVVVAVLVGDAVAVVVARALAAAGAVRGVRPVEPEGAAVGVHRRQDVKGPRIGQILKRLDTSPVLGEIPDEIKRGLSALDLVAVDVAVNIHRGLRSIRARRRIVDRDAPEVAPLDALAETRHRQLVRVPIDQGPHRLDQLGIIIEPVERQRDLRRGEDLVVGREKPLHAPS